MRTFSKSLSAVLVLLSTLAVSLPAAAQSTYQETTIQGEITYAVHPDFEAFTGELETPLTFVALITEDITSFNLTSNGSGGYLTYDTTTAYEFWLYDNEGTEILYDRVDLRDTDTSLTDRVAIYHDAEASYPESAMWGIIATKTGRTEYSLGPNFFGSRVSPLGPQNSPLVESYLPYPKLVTGQTVFPFQAVAQERFSEPNFRFEGTATYISYDGVEVDSDGDGFGDGVDSCINSSMDETVVFGGWYDSGVTNYMDDSGCNIMDAYAACQPAEQEETSRFSRFQPRYSGPSYCEKQVSYELTSDGVIDYTEARMLRDALYMSYRSQPR
ncbi:hypothetical protein [Pseudidiomarina salilacus]|uniref:hypothetical protein n=1 Tax=Pseudidiomarina salilacus TaxID=3384452 RepID=UPI00398473FA